MPVHREQTYKLDRAGYCQKLENYYQNVHSNRWQCDSHSITFFSLSLSFLLFFRLSMSMPRSCINNNRRQSHVVRLTPLWRIQSRVKMPLDRDRNALARPLPSGFNPCPSTTTIPSPPPPPQTTHAHFSILLYFRHLGIIKLMLPFSGYAISVSICISTRVQNITCKTWPYYHTYDDWEGKSGEGGEGFKSINIFSKISAAIT